MFALIKNRLVGFLSPNHLRWLFSIIFFFLALNKGVIILKYGLEPYRVIINTVGLPNFASHYGIVAIVVEVCFALGLWERKTFRPAILLAGVLTSFGIVISMALIIFRIKSECGCGLLGDNEYGLLTQKIIIIIGLAVLYNNKNNLFNNEKLT